MGNFFKSVTAPFNPSSWGSDDDPLFGGPLGDMIPGIGDARAQDKANKTNIELYNANQKWMTQMSNTAYQRAMDDMKKAGLNPMLAYQQGGASVPSSSAPTVQASSKTGLASAALQAYTGISAASSQAQQASTAQAQMESSTKLQTATAAKELASTRQIQAETKLKERELRGKGVKDTLDREGGRIIQKLIDSIGGSSSAKEKAENQKSPLINKLGPATKEEESSMFGFLKNKTKG